MVANSARAELAQPSLVASTSQLPNREMQSEAAVRYVREDINLDTNVRKILLSIKTSTGRQEVLVEREELGDVNRLSRTLMKYGKLGGRIDQALVQSFLNSEHHPKRYVTARSGWIGDTLITRYGAFNPVDGVETVFDEENPYSSPASRSGSRDEFLKLVRPFLRESPQLLFAYVLALVPPLAALIGRRQGFSVCYSQQGSSGKTTCIRLAQSLSTKASEDSDLVSFGDTPKGIAAEAPAFACQLTGFNDIKAGSEAGRALAEKLRFLAFGAVNGKTRRGVGGPQSITSNFNLWFISAEHTLAEIFAAGGLQIENGDHARLIDIRIPHPDDGGIFKGAIDPAGRIKALHSVLQTHFGEIMPRWSRMGVRSPQAVSEAGSQLSKSVQFLEERFMAALIAERRLSAFEQRVANHFALIYAAGCLAIKVRLLPVKKAHLLSSVMHMFDQFRATVVEESATPSLMPTLLSFLLDEETFPLAHLGHPLDPVAAVLGFRRHEKAGMRLYVRFEALKDALKTAHETTVRTLLNELVAAGVITPSRSKTTRTVQQLGLGAKERYVVFDITRLKQAAQNSNTDMIRDQGPETSEQPKRQLRY